MKGELVGRARALSLQPLGLSPVQRLTKRTFDLICAIVGILLLGWAIIILACFARFSTGGSGVYRQTRIGQGGKPFEIMKLRTMRAGSDSLSSVTTGDDPRVTRFGRFLRRMKLDELPQLINVVRGEMSIVGPRPDLAEFVPLQGEQAALILSIAPGITGPATLVFRNEEKLLSAQPDPERYNRDVLVPTKAMINEQYVRNWRLASDLRYIALTLRGATLSVEEAMR